MRWQKFTVVLAGLLWAFTFALPALADDSVQWDGLDMMPLGNHLGTVFELYFIESSANGVYAFNLTAQQKEAIARAGYYWIERVSPHSLPVEPVRIIVGTVDMPVASAQPLNFFPVGAATQFTAVEAKMVYGFPLEGPFDALIRIGTVPFTYEPITQLAGNSNMQSILIHEFGHAMGLLSFAEEAGPEAGPTKTVFESYLQGQRDRFDPDYLNNPRVFTGPAAMRVYGDVPWGGRASRPVPMSYESDIGQAESHLGVFNMSMTHLDFRNYTGFMEVELAVYKDLGYEIDLRNFFGRSVYVDGQTISNTAGYFARNQAGSGYVPGQYNTASYGLGLHLFANNTTLIQQADLLSAGWAGTGIRSDGSGNRLTIAPGVRVHAQGPLGTGLLVAYGHDTVVVNRGDIQALGPQGVAARFDLGHNLKATDHYSYYDVSVSPQTETGDPVLDTNARVQILQNALARAALAGPLVSRFDVSGSLLGRSAAIYISENAHVREINFLKGALVSGPIISDYQRYPTLLTFGRAQNAGQAGSGRDAGFSLYYPDLIQGRFNLETHGGHTNLAADYLEVESVLVKEHSTLQLGGNGLLNSTYGLTNQGRLMPGATVGLGRATIQGGLVNDPTGELFFRFGGSSFPYSDSLQVQGGPLVFNGGWIGVAALPDTGVYEVGGPVYPIISSAEAIINAEPQAVNAGAPFKPALARNGQELGFYFNDTYKYGELGQTANQRIMGQYMEQIIGRSVDSGTDLFRIASALGASTHPQSPLSTGRALEELSGSAYASLANLRARGANLSNSILAGRLRNPELEDSLFSAPDKEDKARFWSKAYASSGYFRSDGQVSGADYESQSLAAGLDYATAWADYLGFYVGYLQDKADFSDITAQGKNKNALLGLYWAAHNDLGYALALGSFSAGHYEMERSMNFAGRNAEGSGNNYWGSIYGEIGCEFAPFQRLSIKPFAGLQYLNLHQDSSEESQANDLNLAVDSLNSDSLISSLGLTLAYMAPWEQGFWGVNLHGQWQHEYLDTVQEISAGLPRLSADKFTVEGLDLNRDWFLAGLSLEWVHEAWKVYAGYDCLFGDDQLIHLAQLGLSFAW